MATGSNDKTVKLMRFNADTSNLEGTISRTLVIRRVKLHPESRMTVESLGFEGFGFT